MRAGNKPTQCIVLVFSDILRSFPRRLATGPIVSRKVILAWRIFALLFVGSYFVAEPGAANGVYFHYFTNWTFTLFAVTSAVGAVVSVQDLRVSHHVNEGNRALFTHIMLLLPFDAPSP